MSRTERSRRKPILAILGVFALCLAGAGEARAVQAYAHTYTVILEGAAGGPLQDSEGTAGYNNTGFQLGFSVVGEGDVRVGGRLGSIDFDGETVGPLANATLDYVNVGGEYRFNEGLYESGVYFGLGFYELDGNPTGGGEGSESSAGLALGLVGEFELAKRLGLMLEVTSHTTDLDASEIFLTGHLGLAIHF